MKEHVVVNCGKNREPIETDAERGSVLAPCKHAQRSDRGKLSPIRGDIRYDFIRTELYCSNELCVWRIARNKRSSFEYDTKPYNT